jgi:hypothetical protein
MPTKGVRTVGNREKSHTYRGEMQRNSSLQQPDFKMRVTRLSKTPTMSLKMLAIPTGIAALFA